MELQQLEDEHLKPIVDKFTKYGNRSENISAAVYDSDWVDKSPEIRRLVYIMSSTVNRKLVYNAGPFNEVTVVTFIQIVKVTISFYRLMCTTTLSDSGS
ncbi:unnamed protein product [Plutella xylostella]|uniref:(diamondback moth) hypothetical protein n=1 Tax=Plutella xylostella TaxID=51655 RepID=A0A8S4FAE7_PLUXY|nr:unnamed protein product [Plutella xylostella]